MKKITSRDLRQTCGVLVLIAAATHAGAQVPSTGPDAPPGTPPPAPVHSVDDDSYLFGLTFGEQMHRVGITDQVSIDAITRGLKDGLQGKKTTPADQQQLNAYVRSIMEEALAHNKAAAKDFLARNSHEKGVTTTASGLEYKVLAAGNRKAPAVLPTDEVTVQYRGKLLDGTEFDSSYTRGMPATFTVNGVIKGWQEALVLMKPGAKWQVFVPPELAYDTSPRPGIPAGSLLIFEVELVNVKPSAAAASAPAPAQTNAKPAAK